MRSLLLLTLSSHYKLTATSTYRRVSAMYGLYFFLRTQILARHQYKQPWREASIYKKKSESMKISFGRFSNRGEGGGKSLKKEQNHPIEAGRQEEGGKKCCFCPYLFSTFSISNVLPKNEENILQEWPAEVEPRSGTHSAWQRANPNQLQVATNRSRPAQKDNAVSTQH